MPSKNHNWSRRDFLRAAGAAGLGSIIAPIDRLAESSNESVAMPTRLFGRTGVRVPILGFGGSLDLDQLMLRQAAKWGVTYWTLPTMDKLMQLIGIILLYLVGLSGSAEIIGKKCA